MALEKSVLTFDAIKVLINKHYGIVITDVKKCVSEARTALSFLTELINIFSRNFKARFHPKLCIAKLKSLNIFQKNRSRLLDSIKQ